VHLGRRLDHRVKQGRDIGRLDVRKDFLGEFWPETPVYRLPNAALALLPQFGNMDAVIDFQCLFNGRARRVSLADALGREDVPRLLASHRERKVRGVVLPERMTLTLASFPHNECKRLGACSDAYGQAAKRSVVIVPLPCFCERQAADALIREPHFRTPFVRN
jgi:hypothetical protein